VLGRRLQPLLAFPYGLHHQSQCGRFFTPRIGNDRGKQARAFAPARLHLEDAAGPNGCAQDGQQGHPDEIRGTGKRFRDFPDEPS